MGGALLDLVAKGGQDVYLICNPQMSYFKTVYKRHTNFSIEYTKNQFNTIMDFGSTTTYTFPRQGDLIKNIFLQFELPDLISTDGRDASYVNYIGYALIDYIELYINTQKIDTITGEWLYIYNELSVKEGKKNGYKEMVGGYEFIGYNSIIGNQGGTYIIPLNFWFCKDVHSAIPHVALQYSDVQIKIKLRPFKELWVTQDGNAPLGDFKIKDSYISIENVYLDTEERKEFATKPHEYLIKQIQYNVNNNIIANTQKKTIDLKFNHPILELIWIVQTKSKFTTVEQGGNDYFNYSKTDIYPFKETIKTAKIKLNGQDRTSDMTNKELRFFNPIQCHTSIPNNYIYVYSFSLFPEEYQPSGSCNFSRFDNAQLEIEFEDDIPDSEIKIFAVNYNILRIVKGLAGLAYVN
jgi:hypothetical protein